MLSGSRFSAEVFARTLLKPDFDVRAIFEPRGVDKAHGGRRGTHDDAGRLSAVAGKPDTLEKVAVGYTTGRKDDITTGRQFVSPVDSFGILDPHLLHALLLFVIGDDQAAEDLAVEATQRGSGKHTFGRASGAHHGMNVGAGDGCGNSRRQVSISNQANAGARLANTLDQPA